MSYDPDPGAVPSGIFFTRQLSQRDVGLQVPVNFVTVPAVNLTSACFPNKRYEDIQAAKCFSNLLATGFQRFEIDVYWDTTRLLWSLCPVQLGASHATANATTSIASSTSSRPKLLSSSAGIATPKASARDVYVLSAVDARRIWDGQISRSLTVASSQTFLSGMSLAALPSISTTATVATGTQSTSGTTALGSPGSSIEPGGPLQTSNPTSAPQILIQVGPYSCTPSTNLNLFTQVLASHLDATETNLNATLKYFIMNLHAAASITNPTGRANMVPSSDLPLGNQLLGSIISYNTSSYLYTPEDLLQQRQNLNGSGSWYNVIRSSQPDSSYFVVDGNHGHSTTPDGWPSESFVEMEKGKRLFVGFGQIDPQMQDYNFSGDASTIFPAQYLQASVPVSQKANGQIESGCFFQPNTELVSDANNSWATASDFVSASTALELELLGASNLTLCGISPILNRTLGGGTADQDYQPYSDYTQSTIWSWGPGEPENITRGDNNIGFQNRCAVLNSTSGHWQSESCGQTHYSACQQSTSPYLWGLSDQRASYAKAGISCDDNSGFSTPHTALENAYLVHTWRHAVTTYDLDDKLLWINFNDLNAKSCWVIGQNTTCPYLSQTSAKRTIIVPTVAAVIVFVLAALTVFVKCAANRQTSKSRRRRGDDGWDYEGVPS